MKLFREPLFQFLLVGAALFLVFRWLNPPATSGPERIEISDGLIDHLTTSFARTWQRPPTEAEMQGLIREHIRDEVAYREAIKLGLDRDDSIVRKRMRQKLEFLSDDTAALMEPEPGELERFYEENAEKYALDPEMAFVQIYLNPDRHIDVLGVAEDLLEALRSGTVVASEGSALGDALMLPFEVDLSPLWQIRRLFGDAFATEVAACPEGEWSGPIRSGFGLHLVRVGISTPGRNPDLDEVIDEVRRDWMAQRKKDTMDRFYDAMISEYRIAFDEEGTPDAAGGR